MVCFSVSLQITSKLENQCISKNLEEVSIFMILQRNTSVSPKGLTWCCSHASQQLAGAKVCRNRTCPKLNSLPSPPQTAAFLFRAPVCQVSLITGLGAASPLPISNQPQNLVTTKSEMSRWPASLLPPPAFLCLASSVETLPLCPSLSLVFPPHASSLKCGSDRCVPHFKSLAGYPLPIEGKIETPIHGA